MGNSAERTPLAAPPHKLSLEGVREDYRLAELDEQNCRTNPIEQFDRWFLEAQATDLKEPNAMVLATVGEDGKPSNRVVLLKEVSDAGFVFYTNYASRKGRELEANPFCALAFFWAELERQVRIEGKAERVSQEKSEEYFRTRPRGSRLGALASHQSERLSGRHILERRLSELQTRYAGTDDIPKPEEWGGYCVLPYKIEFWQGRTNRLHDRLLYTRDGGGWKIARLSP
jgi:pyridoxamine 5'-phosphate oxidase